LIDQAFTAIGEKNADLVAANDVNRHSVGFQTDTNELFVVDSAKKVVHIPVADKREVARQLVDIAVKKLKR
jgi:phosphopantothenoylcysteine decarboxylase/phosphopantothenate--cysteine ligase